MLALQVPLRCADVRARIALPSRSARDSELVTNSVITDRLFDVTQQRGIRLLPSAPELEPCIQVRFGEPTRLRAVALERAGLEVFDQPVVDRTRVVWQPWLRHDVRSSMRSIMTTTSDTTAAVWLDPSKLTPWAENPRANDGEPVRRVAAAIRKFGFSAPIVARAANLEIIAGHTRWKAALLIGLERVPVRLMDVDEQTAHLMALSDNRLGELSEWTGDLAALLTGFDQADIHIAGWSRADLDRLMTVPDATKLDEDAAPRLDRPGEVEGVSSCPSCGYDLRSVRVASKKPPMQ